MRKGIISIVFCIIAVFSLAVTANAELDTNKKAWLEKTHYGYGLLNNDEKLAYEAIYDGVENENHVISFDVKWQITENQFNKIYRYYLFDSPEHCWLWGDGKDFTVYPTIQLIEKGAKVTFEPPHYGNKTTMEGTFKSAIDTIVKKANSGTTYEKALKAYDLLALQVDYDYSALSGGNNYAHRAYGALVNSKAVCDGYAYAYQVILNKMGIKAITVPGYGKETVNGAHAWNMVEFEPNKWAYVDVTWDDQYDKTNSNKKIGVLHYYFGRTDDIIATDMAELNSGGKADHLIDIGEVGNRQTYDKLPKCAENNEEGKSPYWFKDIIAKTVSDLDASKIAKTAIKYDSSQKVAFDIIFYDSKENLKKWVQPNAMSICTDAIMCDIGEIEGRDNYYIVNFYFHNHSTVEATCLDKAYCSICGKIMSNDFGPHTLGPLVQRVAATTTETGLKAHYECSVCGCYFDKDTKKEVSYESLIIQSYIPGDINGDKYINNRDVIALFQYWQDKNVNVVVDACDTHGDKEFNSKDILHLFRYISYPSKRTKDYILH